MLVIVPSRGRPWAVPELWKAWIDTTDAAEMLLCLDEDDPTLPEYQAELRKLRSGPRVRVGARRRLAGTLNEVAAEEADNYPFLGFWGDDNRPRTKHWDSRLTEELRNLGTGFVYGNDLIQAHRMPTAVAMTSDIPRTLGYMCPPGFVHLCLDLVWLRLGRGIDRITYLPDVVIEHLHHTRGKSEFDETYADCNSPERNLHDNARYREYCRQELAVDVWKLRKIIK